ncbi:uncharacterized protein [Procambarus clarkii]|uniref:uncharacterized protein n=1 Tax=Procambarus clarkii TaxID=6728 RepID=UPI001E676637|nr:uncharacterized protein LOC123770635 [Procambarus clarkii]
MILNDTPLVDDPLVDDSVDPVLDVALWGDKAVTPFVASVHVWPRSLAVATLALAGGGKMLLVTYMVDGEGLKRLLVLASLVVILLTVLLVARVLRGRDQGRDRGRGRDQGRDQGRDRGSRDESWEDMTKRKTKRRRRTVAVKTTAISRVFSGRGKRWRRKRRQGGACASTGWCLVSWLRLLPSRVSSTLTSLTSLLLFLESFLSSVATQLLLITSACNNVSAALSTVLSAAATLSSTLGREFSSYTQQSFTRV